MMVKPLHVEITGKPRDTESGHAWFGGGRLEKYLSRQLVGRLPYLTSGFEAESGEAIPRLRLTRGLLSTD